MRRRSPCCATKRTRKSVRSDEGAVMGVEAGSRREGLAATSLAVADTGGVVAIKTLLDERGNAAVVYFRLGASGAEGVVKRERAVAAEDHAGLGAVGNGREAEAFSRAADLLRCARSQAAVEASSARRRSHHSAAAAHL